MKSSRNIEIERIGNWIIYSLFVPLVFFSLTCFIFNFLEPLNPSANPSAMKRLIGSGDLVLIAASVLLGTHLEFRKSHPIGPLSQILYIWCLPLGIITYCLYVLFKLAGGVCESSLVANTPLPNSYYCYPNNHMALNVVIMLGAAICSLAVFVIRFSDKRIQAKTQNASQPRVP
jgi:hypothetical protein